MKYDIDDIALRVENAKTKFKNTIFVSLFVVFSSIGAAICYPDVTVVFICTAIIIFTMFYLYKFLHKNNPIITFSKGFRGVNIKEHEYVTAGSRLTRYGGFSYKYIPSRHKGDVYVRCEDDKIVVVAHLPKKHLDIYEIGDTLICYPGTRFPNVEGRDALQMPCPICGYVNSAEDEKCCSCGLKMAKM